MRRSDGFQLGIEALLTDGKKVLRGRRVGLLAHPASVDTRGCHSSVLLREVCGDKLVALFGPEHGFFGRGAAGEQIGDERHPAWGIPIHSLYGRHRRPTEEMLRDLDVLVFDLQDIGVRCYTFVSTLRYVMEECARLGKTLVVSDRPVPLPHVIDGPMPDGRHDSFVCDVPAPLVYAMTPGETAYWLQQKLSLRDLDLRVADMRCYDAPVSRRATWGPWISPSPGIRSWETGQIYPATVCFEALPAIEYGRGGTEPFQIVSAPWIVAEELAERLNAEDMPQVAFHPHWSPRPGVRIALARSTQCWPVTVGMRILSVLQELYGAERLWGAEGTREGFFDQLMGTDEVRRIVRSGMARNLGRMWSEASRSFAEERRAALLYDRP